MLLGSLSCALPAIGLAGISPDREPRSMHEPRGHGGNGRQRLEGRGQCRDIVEPNDTLVILESMKMEIPVPAEVAGVITEMTVNEGDVVNEGDSIAVIEPS